jgi:hypothetical protein
VDRLMLLGHQVICLDNFQTGHKTNVAHWYVLCQLRLQQDWTSPLWACSTRCRWSVYDWSRRNLSPGVSSLTSSIPVKSYQNS